MLENIPGRAQTSLIEGHGANLMGPGLMVPTRFTEVVRFRSEPPAGVIALW